MTEHIQIQSCS